MNQINLGAEIYQLVFLDLPCSVVDKRRNTRISNSNVQRLECTSYTLMCTFLASINKHERSKQESLQKQAIILPTFSEQFMTN